jgi:DNA invertase Pin-like site-specific DNA recombinase
MIRVPCAIYTRKSSDEGLGQDFNSLHAQREACAAYILSQKSEGWQALSAHYDDGGYSGGNMERPALQRLMTDIAAGRVKVIVVYKVDRLTRSLADFAKLVELFDAQCVSFVSVTQQFNTTTSMGRLTLNVLLSFAQFEREVTGERIRDKIAASKKKGMWMGGFVPVGYLAHQRTLVINEPEADRVREIYRLYIELGDVNKLKAELDRRGWATPARSRGKGNQTGERPFSRGHLYHLLANPVYRGQIRHKDQLYPGQHPAIIDQDLWDQVQATLEKNRRGHKGRAMASDPSLLAGWVFDGEGQRLTPTHASKGNRRYRYYVSQNLVGSPRSAAERGLRIPAGELEAAVQAAIINYLKDSNRLVADLGSAEAKVVQVWLQAADDLAWQMERATIRERIPLLAQVVTRITVHQEGLDIRLSLALRDGHPRVTTQITLPIRLRSSGYGLRLIIACQEHAPAGRVDPHLVQAVNRGIGWFREQASDASRGTSAIAKAEGLSKSHVARLIYLAFLAPDIVAAIRAGTQPASLKVNWLIRSVPLPMCWHEQRRLLGFPELRS